MWIVDLVWPKTCEICGVKGSMICGPCFLSLTGADSKCAGCYRYSIQGVTHKKCKSKTELSGLTSLFLYKDEKVSKLIWATKYEERWGVLLDLLIGVKRPKFDFDFIAYVPMTEKKKKERGYNQSKMLALILSKFWGVLVLNGLSKQKETKSLANTKNAIERRRIIEGAFTYSGPRLDGKSVLLVDDVFTSGATMNEIAKTLRALGALKVYGWSIAS